MELKDWIATLTVILQLITAMIMLRTANRESKKGTPRKRRKRK